MAKRLIPLLDRVLVEKLAPPTKTVGGVLLPETASKVRAVCRAHSACPTSVLVACTRGAWHVCRMTHQVTSMQSGIQSAAGCFA